MSDQPVTRRRFLALLPGLGLAGAVVGAESLAAAGGATRAGRRPAGHPDPRPGIDGSKVLGADDLTSYPDLVPLFDGIREHAALADGVVCYCGCAELPGYRSLLTCFEEGFDMGRFCPICQGQGRLLVGRAEEGQDLAQIRRAIDARYAGGGHAHAASAAAGRETAADRRRRLARAPSRFGALLLATLVLPFSAEGQVRASERSVFAQTIDGTTVTIEYSRPRARGREGLFGEVVSWGKVWTPGANQATTLAADEDVTLNGHPLAAGKYSVWMVVREEGDWEAVIDPDSTRFHTQPPDSAEGQVRFPVTPQEAPHMEALTWYAPTYHASGMTLHMHWGETVVPIEVGVEPSQRLAATAEEARPVVGSYHIEWLIPSDGEEAEGHGENRNEVGAEAAGANGTAAEARENGFEITQHDDGSLHVMTTPPDSPHWPDPLELILLPRSEGVFIPAMAMDGELAEPMHGVLVEFVVGDGPSPSFEIRTERDDLLARGTRAEG